MFGRDAWYGASLRKSRRLRSGPSAEGARLLMGLHSAHAAPVESHVPSSRTSKFAGKPHILRRHGPIRTAHFITSLPLWAAR